MADKESILWNNMNNDNGCNKERCLLNNWQRYHGNGDKGENNKGSGRYILRRQEKYITPFEALETELQYISELAGSDCVWYLLT